MVTALQARSDVPAVSDVAVDDLGAGTGPAWLESWMRAHSGEVVGWRRAIHAQPELARREHLTTARISETLMKAGLEPRTLPGGTGLVCDIGHGEPLVALRADIDALPLEEQTGLGFSSTVPGAMHACGHDAHTAMLLGAGLALASAPSLPGRVRLLFQPAEEVQPGGALDMVEDGVMKDVQRVFALHCDPRLEVGRLGTRVGPITSACDLLEIRLTSPGGHTSRPHLTADLVEALGLLITQVPLLLTRHVDPRSGTVMTWGAVHAGEAANAIPQSGLVRGTLRTADHATWLGLEETLRSLVASVLAPTGVGYVLDHIRGVPPVVNDADSSAMLRDSAVLIGGEDAAAGTEQSSGGEDFAWYLEHAPGAMARLGVWPGDGPMRDIHQPTFDLDERAIPFGVRTLVQTALTALDAG
ncbi:amidohydrolase [Pseudonocardia sp. KRD291]|uniref:amidohydrolase n=1 Tax=Pseudonocardia sp. KRD291 TaxID=2792007 RepID=UPI001C4A1C1D|nr:amidohydrolase [Pseudonocardia sp. KRD291]MBW0106261.1 amidohydrolase [Pseudonocardia sp. KRD291]